MRTRKTIAISASRVIWRTVSSLIIILLFFISCGSETDNTNEYLEETSYPEETSNSEIENEMKEELKVYDSYGDLVTINPTDNPRIVSMATWCPYSKQLKSFLTDSQIKPSFSNFDLIFLFEKNEWNNMRKVVKNAFENGEITEEQLNIAFNNIEASELESPFVDITMTHDLPGKIYFFDESCNVKIDGFPNFYNHTNNYLDLDAQTWLLENTNIPRDLLLTKWSEYYPPQEVY